MSVGGRRGVERRRSGHGGRGGADEVAAQRRDAVALRPLGQQRAGAVAEFRRHDVVADRVVEERHVEDLRDRLADERLGLQA